MILGRLMMLAFWRRGTLSQENQTAAKLVPALELISYSIFWVFLHTRPSQLIQDG